MYTDNRDAYRQTFFISWQKHLKKLPLEPLEAQLVGIMLQHPEYHLLLEKGDQLTQEYEIEENPFFHMGLHLSVREQIQLNRPRGVTECYQQLIAQSFAPLEAEHKIMGVLMQTIGMAQQTGVMNEEEYLKQLKKLTV